MKRTRSDSTDSEDSIKRLRSESTDSEDSMTSHTERTTFEDNDIEKVLQNLSQSISKEKALAFLHTLTASKSILYWNSHGEMTYHARRIPVTSIAELIEYVMQPLNLDVKVPRGLKTFTQGLSEIGIDKKLIRNKKVLADLVARQPEEDETDSETSDENSERESLESDSESVGESLESEEHSEPEISESDEELQECHVCRDFRPFYNIPVVQCPTCLWSEGYYARDNELVECDICSHIFPVDEHTTKVKFYRCRDCDAVHQLSLKFKKLKLMDDHNQEDSE